ncbi:hypothetical protein PRUB_a2014 [Pseudoalteromonas rubra]|uniref:Uncharacterized protein n=1 Tax=Pseudoalteromonas rubra TaxID=43658 RepID=A0A8T0CGX9_9GAMM|nr:hypothetical protein PRUB_a2014 [Pseudoalteromonas rubra]
MTVQGEPVQLAHCAEEPHATSVLTDNPGATHICIVLKLPLLSVALVEIETLLFLLK